MVMKDIFHNLNLRIKYYKYQCKQNFWDGTSKNYHYNKDLMTFKTFLNKKTL